MTHAPDDIQLPPSLRFLKALVITLMLCMIAGVIAVSALLVTRLREDPRAEPLSVSLPATISLPQGAKALAVTFGAGWIGVVTDQNQFLVFTPEGALRQSVVIESATP